jgi:hypothetical protein
MRQRLIGRRPVVVPPVVLPSAVMPPPGPAWSERGSGLFASAFGLLFFLGFLLVASQALLTLHEASAVRAVAFDAAHRAAEARGPLQRSCTAVLEEQARLHAVDVLGSRARAEVRCVGDESVEVTVEMPAPPLVGLLGSTVVRRTAEVRFEAPRQVTG